MVRPELRTGEGSGLGPGTQRRSELQGCVRVCAYSALGPGEGEGVSLRNFPLGLLLCLP